VASAEYFMPKIMAVVKTKMLKQFRKMLN